MSDESADVGGVGETTSDARSETALGSLAERWRRLRENEVAVVALTALAVFVFPYLFSEGRSPVGDLVGGYQSLAALVLIWGIFVVGFDLLHGYTGLLSFGHAAFWGAGAYAAGIFATEMYNGPIAMILVGLAVSVLLAWVLGFLALRRGGIYFAILTLAFGQMFYFIAFQPLSGLTGGDNGLGFSVGPLLGFVPGMPSIPLGAGVPVVTAFVGDWLYVLVGTVTVLAVAVGYRVLNSPYGLVFDAIRENEQRAEFVGLNVWRYKLMAFVISGAFAGVAGSLYAIHGAYVPLESLYWTTSGEVVIMSVLGGVGSLFGGLVGAGLYLWVEVIFAGFDALVVPLPFTDAYFVVLYDVGTYWHLALGLLFVVVVVLFPSGVWGALRDLRWFVALAARDPSAAGDYAVAKLRAAGGWTAGKIRGVVPVGGGR